MLIKVSLCFIGDLYNLCLNGKRLFVAERVKQTEYVHNEKMKHGFAKFLIRTVFIQRAPSWNKFDLDKHCVGSFIMWKLKNTRKNETKIPVTTASEATDMAGPKEVEKK